MILGKKNLRNIVSAYCTLKENIPDQPKELKFKKSNVN